MTPGIIITTITTITITITNRHFLLLGGMTIQNMCLLLKQHLNMCKEF